MLWGWNVRKRILKLRTFGDISDVYKPLPTKILQAATSFLHFGLIHWPQRKHLGTCRKKTLKGEDSYPFSNRGSGKLPQMKGNLPFWRYSLNFSRLYNGREGDFQLPLRDFSATKRHVRFQGLILSWKIHPEGSYCLIGVSQLSLVKLNLEDPNFKEFQRSESDCSFKIICLGDQWFLFGDCFLCSWLMIMWRSRSSSNKNHPQLQPCSLRRPSSKRFPCWVP